MYGKRRPRSRPAAASLQCSRKLTGELSATRTEGEWSTGADGIMKRHGVGTYKSGDNEYVGEWKDDAMDGAGKFTFASGAVYEVCPRADARRRHGPQQLHRKPAANRGARCAWQGTWTNNQFMGEGKYEWADKTSYTGGWADNKCASCCMPMLPHPARRATVADGGRFLPLAGCTVTGHTWTARRKSTRVRFLTATALSCSTSSKSAGVRRGRGQR